MTPDRAQTVGDTEIKEYYWSGRMVVYVNNKFVEMSFDQAVAVARENSKNIETDGSDGT
jgi:hypothetical protein